MNKILIVDDEISVRMILSEILQKNGFQPAEAEDGGQAVAMFRNEKFDLVLLDIAMPGLDGIETLQELKRIDADVPVIIVTGHADIATAVESIKLGAYDFLAKPPQVSRLLVTLQRAVEQSRLQQSVRVLDKSVESSLEWIFGKSTAIKGVIQQLRQVAGSNFSVIVQGETGTGKSVVAQAIHNLSGRAAHPFQVVDIGVIPETLIESELFGHEKGAFTGADKKKKGFFETANGGTILIDELENMSAAMQGKLLRAVEEKRITPLGATKPVDIDVRIVGATNVDLKKMVKEKTFRQDLFFRLGEFFMDLPPLRERLDDIPFLATKFLLKAGIELNKQMYDLDADTIDMLQRYPWPGNVRELKNLVRRAALLSESGSVRPEHLDFLIEDKWDRKEAYPLLPLKEVAAMAVREAEKKAIRRVLELTKGNKSKAASMLEVDYKTLLTKIKEYN